MDKCYAKGQTLTVKLHDEDGYYKGKYQYTNADHTFITLADVVSYPNMKEHDAHFTFYVNEVESIETEESNEELEAVLDKTSGRSLAHHKGPSHPHLSRMHGQNLTTLPPSLMRPKLNPHTSRVLNVEQLSKYRGLLKNFFVVDKMDETFEEAMKTINQFPFVGVGVEGVVLGRHGHLCWVNVSTPNETFLFDVIRLTDRVFEEGLRDLLESEDIVKIMHDCRMASDCLYHQFGIYLTNVMDTQAMDTMLVRSETDRCPSFVSSLNDCLIRYLHLPDHMLDFPILREGHLREETAHWAIRPLPTEALTIAVQRVAFLYPLRLALLRALSEPSRLASRLYVDQVIGLPDEDASMFYGCIHMTPRQMCFLGKRKHNDNRNNGNSHIRFSRDVMHLRNDDGAGQSSGAPPQNARPHCSDASVDGLQNKIKCFGLDGPPH